MQINEAETSLKLFQAVTLFCFSFISGCVMLLKICVWDLESYSAI